MNRGRRYELEFKAILEEAGYVVEGPPPRNRWGKEDYFNVYDLIAVDPKRSKPWWVQVASYKQASKKRLKLREWLNGDGGGLRFETVLALRRPDHTPGKRGSWVIQQMRVDGAWYTSHALSDFFWGAKEVS